MPLACMDIWQCGEDYERRIKAFHELMPRRVSEILLVSSLYDYCIMEEDGRLAERIIHEYLGLNLTRPPRITWVPSPQTALLTLERQTFQLAIVMPRLSERDPAALPREIKALYPDLPVHLLTHRNPSPQTRQVIKVPPPGVDRIFIWSGNTDLLLAQIKSVEDGWNVEHDTEIAGVRVILFVEDSPFHLSSLLPILYREVVCQTQAAMEEGLNEEHRILTMRCRAKILVTQSYEEALLVFQRFKSNLLGVISDVRFPRQGRLDDNAGLDLLSRIQMEIHDIPLLLTSSDAHNQEKADAVSASFLLKSSPTLHADIHSFFLSCLGFGDFVFRMPDGREVARASNRRALEQALKRLPLESFVYHANRNDFSRWLFARSEIFLALKFRPLTGEDFEGDMEKRRENLCQTLELQRKWRQKGIVADFDAEDFDLDTELLKIGRGSLGGKARGLVFVANLLKRKPVLFRRYPDVDIQVPRTLTLTTDVFDAVLRQAELKDLSRLEATDEEIASRFLLVPFPGETALALRAFLHRMHHPLAIRSSSLLEDAQFQAYAGLYQTYMLPNDHPSLEERLRQLLAAIRMVYASTYFAAPKAFAHRVGQRTEEERMAVVIQTLVGRTHRGFFYPTVSGVAQSYNYYPFGRVKPEDGCMTIALGLGKTVMEGNSALRLSPRHPQVLPQLSRVEDVLKSSQRRFYAVRMGGGTAPSVEKTDPNLVPREVPDADGEPPLAMAAGTYVPAEDRIRDSAHGPGHRVITFAPILKHSAFPLCGLVNDILSLAEEGMGAPVEIEFCSDPFRVENRRPTFAILQVRPMTARTELMEVEIDPEEVGEAFCYSTHALGNTSREDIRDIVYVKPRAFDPARTSEIAAEIGMFNGKMTALGLPYLLVGPGRWGSADRWMGIPVAWSDISGVAGLVEDGTGRLKVEPSQGSHFFHNVTTLGISYLTVAGSPDVLRWEQLEVLPSASEREFVAHVRMNKPCTLKVDGRRSVGVIHVHQEGAFAEDRKWMIS